MRSRSRSNLVLIVSRVCLNYTRYAIAATSIISQLDNASSPALEDLSLDLGIDPRLKLFTKSYDEYLPPRSCLMNAVEALAFLAGKDYHGTTPMTSTSIPGYTDVQVVIRPPDGKLTVPVKPAVLGLYLAVVTLTTHPMFQGKFQVTSWIVLWEDVTVAYIFLQLSGLGNQTQAQNLTAISLGTMLKLNDTTPITLSENSDNGNADNSTNAPNTDVELIMTFYPWGTPLREISVFVTVLGALKDVAGYPSTDVVVDFEIMVPLSDVSIAFVKEASTGLTGPPSFEYRWVIDAAKQIPLWMVHHRFWESFFTIRVNDYVVGEGWVRHATYAGLDGNRTIS